MGCIPAQLNIIIMLVNMSHHWTKVLDDGESVHAVFVSYIKAFDYADHTPEETEEIVWLRHPRFYHVWLFLSSNNASKELRLVMLCQVQ